MRLFAALLFIALLVIPARLFGAESSTESPRKVPAVRVAQPAAKMPSISGSITGATPGTQSASAIAKPNGLGPSLQTRRIPLEGETVTWDVLASSGGAMTSGDLVLEGTLGQAIAGESVAPIAMLNAGFWQDFGQGNFLCGDVFKNNRVDITDAVFIIQYIFASGPAPVPIEAGDVDCNSRIAISDAVYIIQYLFANGPVPCANCL